MNSTRTSLARVALGAIAVAASACAGQPSDAQAPPAAPATVSSAPVARSAPPVDHQLYTLADLQALARSGSWLELLAHAEDIRPSERDVTWKKLVAAAATGAIEADRRADRNREQLAIAVQAFSDRYPSLGESKELAALGASVMVEGVTRCTADHPEFEPCMWFAAAFPGDAAHAQAAGDAAMARGHRPLALKLFRVAADLDARTLCQDDAALTAVAETRSGQGNAAAVADGESIHASCERAKKQR